MRPAQAQKLHDRGIVKMARELKRRADQRRYRPNCNLGEPYALPDNQKAYSATIGIHGWVFSLALVVHEDEVSHWRGRAAPRNGFSEALSAEDLDVLGIVVGEVTADDASVLSMLREQLEGRRPSDGGFQFFWFEGKGAPKSPLQGILRAMGTLASESVREIGDAELRNMHEVLATAHAELSGSTSSAEERVTLLEKIDEALVILEAEEARRKDPASGEGMIA